MEFSKPEEPNTSILMEFLKHVILTLPNDNNSGSLCNFLVKLLSAKMAKEIKFQQKFDFQIGRLNLQVDLMKQMRDWLYPKRLEIHQSFESISNEKKRFVTQGLKVCLLLFSEYKAAN